MMIPYNPPMPGDFPLPISIGDAPAAWPQVAQEPVNLIALLPPSDTDASAPFTLDQVVGLFSQVSDSDFTIVDRPPLPEDAVWAALIAGPSLPAPVVVWLAPAKPLPEDTVKFLSSEGCKWVVGIETMLDPETPHQHLVLLVQLLGRAFPKSPGILNVNSGVWKRRDELDDRLLIEGLIVSPGIAWVVHVIGNESEDPAKPPRLWAFTCGRWT